MGVTFRVLYAASVVVWLVAIASSPALKGWTTRAGETRQKATTTNDAIYTKAQADGAKAQFDKICADCHPFTVAAKKKPKDKPLGDDPFFEEWSGRPLTELITLIALTMPNDGSVAVTEKEATDLVAYMLQQNGFAAGSNPLTRETASAIVERPKK
jgi:S-disulfanyl-L-cysteine oxidoreductase SoxD